MKVRVNGAPPAKTPAPVNKAEIKGQGSIPYAKIVDEKRQTRLRALKPWALLAAWAPCYVAVNFLLVSGFV